MKRIHRIAFLLIAAAFVLISTTCTIDSPLTQAISEKINEDFTVPVAGVTLDKDSINLPVGGTRQLTAAVEPADATGQSVTWSSDDEDFATVDSNGLVTAKAIGSATVTVTTTDGGFTASCSVAVVPSTAKEITAFSFTAADNGELSGDVTGTINGTDISATVPYGTDVTALVATFSTTGASVTVGGTTQISGTTANDFTNPVTYTVTAGDDSTQDYTVTMTIADPEAGYTGTYTADGVSFDMAYVPGSLTFPTGTDDDGNATVTNAYWIADTELTYELWSEVHDWATGNGYTFFRSGTQGDGTGDTDQHPVTGVSWRDSIVWCNALTEWYNAKEGTSYECVYTYSGSIIRDSSNAAACDAAVENQTAKGFRLLSSNEYECAARYRDGTLWTYGDHASGDDSGACYDDGSILGGLGMSTVFGNYAWYDDNSDNSTHVVGNAGNGGGAARTGNSNALGLYGMSGNVWEWCFTESGSVRLCRGGGWNGGAGYLQVGDWWDYGPHNAYSNLGFRLCRTAD